MWMWHICCHVYILFFSLSLHLFLHLQFVSLHILFIWMLFLPHRSLIFFLLRRINLNDNKCYWLWVLCDDDDELGDREKSTEISDLKWLLYVPKYIPNRYKYRKNQRLSFCVCVVKWKCSISPLSLSVASNNNKKENWENREFHVIWFHIIWTWKPIKKIKRSSRRKRLKHQ